MITTSKIDIKRGILCISNHFTRGYMTKDNNNAMVNGKITDEANLSTVMAIIQQIKTIRKNIARPE